MSSKSVRSCCRETYIVSAVLFYITVSARKSNRMDKKYAVYFHVNSNKIVSII